MNDTTSRPAMLTESISENQQAPAACGEVSLEQQMVELALSNDAKRFLRSLHLAEKQLNDAFNKGRERGELCDRVSQVYHDLYGVDCETPGSR
jgi:hypothetical protein